MKFPNLAVFCCVFFALALIACDDQRIYAVKFKRVALKSVEEISPLNDSLVEPVLYNNIKGFERLSKAESKSKFISLLLPAILIAKYEREMDQLRLSKLLSKEPWSIVDSIHFKQLLSRYHARNKEELDLRMLTLPNSIVLAQAAAESGWGTSRFFAEANNVFGIWSFSEKDSRIEAHAVRGDKKVFLRAYRDLSGSVVDYFNVLSSSNAFRGLRIIRQSTDNPFKLIPYLKNYSERRRAYTKLIERIVIQNNLQQYDHYKIDPAFLEEED